MLDKTIIHHTEPICTKCAHFRIGDMGRDQETYKCDAFPEGIPEAILASDHDHKKPFPDDQGIRFKHINEAEVFEKDLEIKMPKPLNK